MSANNWLSHVLTLNEIDKIDNLAIYKFYNVVCVKVNVLKYSIELKSFLVQRYRHVNERPTVLQNLHNLKP